MASPTYIYKIVPSSTPPPSPLPEALPVSDLDASDDFIHASTSKQLLGTLSRFFSTATSVFILRIPYEKVKAAGVVKWEARDGRPGEEWEEECFPHLYNGLKVGREEVDEVGVWERGPNGWSAEGWPFGEVDVPESAPAQGQLQA